MKVSEELLFQATREVFLAHRHDLVIIKNRYGTWTVAVNGGFDANGEEVSSPDKNKAIQKMVQKFGYIQEVMAKLQAQS